MKPYLLIAGDNYYPSAYTDDWIDCYETKEEAKEKIENCITCRTQKRRELHELPYAEKERVA